MIDNVAAATKATQHLIALGRTRIAFAGHEEHGQSATSTQRLMGYQEALEQAGRRVDMSLLLPSRSISSHDAAESVGAALDQGLQLRRPRLPRRPRRDRLAPGDRRSVG